MKIVLEDGRVIGSDVLITSILRWDCVPIVANFEFQVILDQQLDKALQVGSKIFVGKENHTFVIDKRSIFNSSIVRDDKQINIGAYIAVLKGTEDLIIPKDGDAIYLKDTSIGRALRAAGVAVAIGDDVPLQRFLCPVGDTPTFPIAKALGEEAALMFYGRDKKIHIQRLNALATKEVKHRLSEVDIQWIGSNTKINHTVKSYQTNNIDGATIEGDLRGKAVTGFLPNRDARRAKNLSTVLIRRGVAIKSLDGDWFGGDVVAVGSKKLVVLTAAHRYDSGILGEASVTATTVFLAEVVKV